MTSTGTRRRRRLLRGYLAGLNKTPALGRWVDDTRVVLDRLSSLPATSAAGRLAARLDVRRVGVFGHSMGGVTAGQFCVDDARCAAGLNLDGIPQSGTMIDKPMPRPFLMVYSARPGRLGASDPIYQRAARPYYRVDVADTRHLDFSDMALWGGPPAAAEAGLIDPCAPARFDHSRDRAAILDQSIGPPLDAAGRNVVVSEVKVISAKPLPATARQ